MFQKYRHEIRQLEMLSSNVVTKDIPYDNHHISSALDLSVELRSMSHLIYITCF